METLLAALLFVGVQIVPVPVGMADTGVIAAYDEAGAILYWDGENVVSLVHESTHVLQGCLAPALGEYAPIGWESRQLSEMAKAIRQSRVYQAQAERNGVSIAHTATLEAEAYWAGRHLSSDEDMDLLGRLIVANCS